MVWQDGATEIPRNWKLGAKNCEFEQIILHVYYEFDKYLFKIANK